MRKHIWTWVPVIALIAAACGDGGVAATVPVPEPGPTSDTAAMTPAQFVTADGITLEGRLLGDGTDFVVLAHMRPATMDSWAPFAEVLAANGFSVLIFNFRGYGNSGGDGFAVDLDTGAAIDFAAARGANRVFVIGASMGGTGAIAAAADRTVAGVVTLSAPAKFEGVDAVEAARRLDAPLLAFAAAGDDSYVDQANELVSAAGGTVIALDGNAHGTNLFKDHGPALRSRILSFLAAGSRP